MPSLSPTLRVLVVDARTDRPVANALVTLDRPAVQGFAPRFADTTPPTDFLPKRNKATTAAVLRFTHEDFAIHPLLPVLATEVGETSLTVALEQGGTVEVVVGDGLGGLAVGVDVLEDVLCDGLRLIDARVATDASGTAKYEHLAPTRHKFRTIPRPRS